MAVNIVRNTYSIPDLTFEDFWEVCHFIQERKSDVQQVVYMVLGSRGGIAMREKDRDRILELIRNSGDVVKKMSATFVESSPGTRSQTGSTKLQYRPEPYEGRPLGLEVYSNSMSKVVLFDLENLITKKFTVQEDEGSLEIEFGDPCEVLVADMDMRGFTAFSEQPHIESPYICGLMSAFYQVTRKCFSRFPADVTKFNGDGVLNIWRTTAADRHVAVESVISGVMDVNRRWQTTRKTALFSHGAPDQIGAGIAFGLASNLNFGQEDFIGRPINLAARLCSNCPGGKVYIDKSVPSLPQDLTLGEASLALKSFGDYSVFELDVCEPVA